MTQIPTTQEIASLVRPEFVHRRLYTDPRLFEREMRAVFGGTWCYVGHESEVPAAGDFVRRRLGRRPLLLIRGDDGEIRALFNRCSHRGTLLMPETSGCAKRFTCPYHGWRFGDDGRLLNVPVPSSYQDVHSGRFDLGRTEVATYRGFVFATVAAEPIDLLEWLGPTREWLDAYIDRYPGGELAVLATPYRSEFRANWKVSWDNAADGIHATFAHRSYNLLGKAADTQTVLARNPVVTPMISRTFAHGHCVVDQRPGIPDGPWATMRPLPTSDALLESLRASGQPREMLDLATGDMVNLSLFPNLLFVGNQLMVVEPLDVDRTRLSLYLTVAPQAPEEVNLLRLRVDEDFVSFGNPDDLEMFERIQEGLGIVEDEWIDTSRGQGLEVEASDGLIGDIATEAPIRGYLAEWTRLMTTATPLAARRRETAPADRSSSRRDRVADR